MAQFQSQAEFWDHYVRAHRDPRTRRLHFAGTALALMCFAVAAITRTLWLAIAAPAVGYAFAWIAHIAVEGNTPATFGHPLRSVAADARMFWLMCRGRMDDEVRRVTGPDRPG
ncbi:MAG: Mpo1-like protein [Gemmatimonas sp.]